MQHTADVTRSEGIVFVPGLLPATLIDAEGEGPFDAYLEVSGQNYSKRLRISVADSMTQISHEGFESYRTNRGNLSLCRSEDSEL
ncbi:hypothetical protein GCM10023166_35650 [Paeniglutamicibacter cryotolerans]